MTHFPYTFEADVVYHHLGTYRYTVVFLPEGLREILPLSEFPRLRIEGELNRKPFEGAWQPSRGRWYLMLGKRLLRQARLEVGDRATVAFRVVDQSTVEVPRELQFALDANSQALAAWQAMTPGKQRGLAHKVASAVRPETRAGRVEDIVEALAEGRDPYRRDQ